MAQNFDYIDPTSDYLPYPTFFHNVGMYLLNRRPIGATKLNKRRFQAAYGASPSVCALLWANLTGILPLSTLAKHLSWELKF